MNINVVNFIFLFRFAKYQREQAIKCVKAAIEDTKVGTYNGFYCRDIKGKDNGRQIDVYPQ